jgi:hypothetical protein
MRSVRTNVTTITIAGCIAAKNVHVIAHNSRHVRSNHVGRNHPGSRLMHYPRSLPLCRRIAKESNQGPTSGSQGGPPAEHRDLVDLTLEVLNEMWRVQLTKRGISFGYGGGGPSEKPPVGDRN